MKPFFSKRASAPSIKTRVPKMLALLAAGLLPAMAAQAQTAEPVYVFKMDAQTAKTVSWVTVGYAYGAWGNTGGHHSCAAWTPAENTVNWGETFSQTRICAQAQIRTKTEQQINPVTKETRLGTVTYENRNVPASEVQPGTGNLDYITGEARLGWSGWSNNGEPYDCSDWEPLPETQPLYDHYQQSRNCSQGQLRSEAVVNTWKSGKQTPKRTDTEDQVVTVAQQQAAVGAKDYISGQRIAPWSDWENEGALTGCSSWTPSAQSQTVLTDFNQSLLCKQPQSSSRDVFDVWRSGLETLNRNEDRAQQVDNTQQRTVKTTLGTWSNTTTDNCGNWSPSPTTQTASFSQSRSCDQNQTRNVSYSTEGGEQLHSFDDLRTVAAGFADSRVVTVNWTNWTDTGSLYGCGGWSPSTSTVSWGQSFTQSRNCTQGTTRNRVYSSGESFAEASSRGVTDTRPATGSSDYIVSTNYGSWSGWSNVGGTYNCGSYSPATSTVNWGQSFTQSRSCSQDRTRSRSVTYVYASGATASGGTQSDSTVASVTDTRSATGTKDYVTGSSTSNWSSWSNSGGLFNCGSWSPDPSTVNWGQSFTQSRSCSQTQTRTRTVTQVYASGATGATSTESGSQTITSSDTQPATGTKNYVTGQTTGAWSDWMMTGAPYNFGTWSPDPSTVTNGLEFIQTTSCSTPESRSQPVFNVYANGAVVQTTNNNESRIGSTTCIRTAYGSKKVSYSWEIVNVSGSCSEPNYEEIGPCTNPGGTRTLMNGQACYSGNKNFVIYLKCM